MAFMEKPPAGKVLLDDTVPLTAQIEASQSLHSHTEYIIRVQRGVSAENSWQIVRRYSDFDLLNNSLQISTLSLPLPPKKLIGNMEREFIAERQKGLQAYLDVITTHHILSNCELVKKFLDPNSYSVNYTEIALQHVSMFFRSEPKWEVVEPLKDIGWRIRKKYFLMKIKNQPKERLMLSWADLGPDKYLSDKDLQYAVKLLSSCSHPYIYKITFATANESSALVIRPFSEKGTLKDLIYKAKPKDPFLKKYCNPKKIQGLELQQIKTYGRQILEVLKFLHEKGFPYGHLHSANVMLDGDTCKLLDLENSLLGLPSFYRSYFSQFRKINTLEGVDVHCFGHLLYEMTYGRPPDTVPVDSFPPAPSVFVVSVLESILTCEAMKNGMPTVSRLLQMPLFSDVLLTNSEKPQFKIPTKLKEALKTSKECTEKRLTEEQKLIHQHRRLTRAQSHHGSEEEKKKRKILARKKSKRSACESGEEHSAKYSNSNNSGSGASSPLTSPSSPTPPSTAGASSVPPAPPPPPLPPAAPPPSTEVPTQPSPQPNVSASRGALLSSIQNFQKGTLKKTQTCDYSAPRIS
ncbi:PX domain-containing protein kinase-like protein isoform X2 [Falco biarmicus]|uniref:PX domain-containing protein kinase-like protein isoform X2 n=1 Tax=Falco rusticolus TaxID=120794 RepID=UPI0018865F58|nr:PX domain-containing protein kinase-like protein isoform X2 [Falco rusticolus]XP_055563663.1 PX domain-containing protein kinase-like protein isoform X2 [Falco cherrug]XP_055660497.1 PX domain-containing protein kinase-like protein isoform X2 [Falco peregrinus]XP_056191161.1 PX domain-containing protein kinase-like protein isoform X2 [Falco biarmicus]